MFYSVFHHFRAFKCVDANFIFSQKNDVTLTRHDVMTQSHRKSRPAPFRAENIFRGSFYECADWQTLEVLRYDDRDLSTISSEEPIRNNRLAPSNFLTNY